MTKPTAQKMIGAITRYVGLNGPIRYGERVKVFQVMHGALLPNYDADSDDTHSWCDEDVLARGGVTENDRIEVRVIHDDGHMSFSMDPRAIDLEMFANLN